MTLSTPILWVVFPLIIAAVVLIFHNRMIFGIVVTSTAALGLALLATFFPEDQTLVLGSLVVTFEESLAILGRSITLTYNIMPFISFIFAITGLWTLISGIPGTPKFFRPISLAITALLTAALGVEPFLYAALFIHIAVLASLPMLSPEGKKPHPGILRYLILQTLALPLILLAGWLLSGVEALPSDSPLVVQSAIILGLGFGFWLGVFPFHSWLPMVSQHAHPTVVSHLMFLIPSTIFVFSLNFFDRYTFLRTLHNLESTLSFLGVLMIFLGGIWTAIQDNLKRAFGFTILTEMGFTLLALSLSSQGGLSWMLMLFPGRALGFWLWGYTMSLIEKHNGSMEFKAVQGFAWRYPLLSSGLLLAQLTIAGLPLLAVFPIKLTILTAVLRNGTPLGIWGFIGSLGLFLFTIRLLAVFIKPNNTSNRKTWAVSEKTHEYLPILIMVLILVILGLFPNMIENLTSTLTTFPQLQ
ncbi:MAG: proton-conducting transporter membrane subunit [Chloroflexota bacterium]|nr:proton-conducting transporter membrane subunit [Chloroflexota bacterium]